MPIALRLNNVQKVYRNGTVGLKPTNLQLEFGRFYGMVGPNGAGKSTFIHLVAGALKPTGGTMEYGITRPEELAWVSQSTSIDWFLPAIDNVLLGARLGGLKASEARHWAQSCLDEVGLDGKHASLPDQLSGGQQRRLQVARALAQRSKILLLDEPTTGLDPIASDRLADRLRLIADDGACVLMASHDLDRLDRVCDQVLWATEGKISLEPQTEKPLTQSLRIHYRGAPSPDLSSILQREGVSIASDDNPLDLIMSPAVKLSGILKMVADRLDILSVQEIPDSLAARYRAQMEGIGKDVQ